MTAKKKPRKKAAKKAAPKKAKPATKVSPWDAALAPRGAEEKRYWLLKSEPDTFSFEDLLRIHNKTTHWDGVRNFVARNFLRQGMKLGDRAFFYHSGDNPAVVGICEVVREAYPDLSAFDTASHGWDPKSNKENPTWYMVDVRAVAQFTHPVTLVQVKARKELKNMAILRIGRLSVTPVTADEWQVITDMANKGRA